MAAALSSHTGWTRAADRETVDPCGLNLSRVVGLSLLLEGALTLRLSSSSFIFNPILLQDAQCVTLKVSGLLSLPWITVTGRCDGWARGEAAEEQPAAVQDAPELRRLQPRQTQPAGRRGGGSVRGEQPAVGRSLPAAGSGRRLNITQWHTKLCILLL